MADGKIPHLGEQGGAAVRGWLSRHKGYRLARFRQVQRAVGACMHATPRRKYVEQGEKTLDRALASLAKKCCTLPTSYPTASIHLPHTHGGLGIPSLTTNYTQIICTNLTRALNDPGKLGCITHALLQT